MKDIRLLEEVKVNLTQKRNEAAKEIGATVPGLTLALIVINNILARELQKKKK